MRKLTSKPYFRRGPAFASAALCRVGTLLARRRSALRCRGNTIAVDGDWKLRPDVESLMDANQQTASESHRRHVSRDGTAVS